MYIHLFLPEMARIFFHFVYYLDSYNNHFRREVRVLYGIKYSLDALDVTKYEASY